MKITMVFLFGLMQMAVFGQTLSPSNSPTKINSLSLPKFNVISNGTGLKLGGFKLQNPNSLVLYNRNTGANDVYSLAYKEDQEDKDWQYEKRASFILLQNEFRGSKIDSFNPYGAESLEQGLLVGALNLLFQ